MTNGEQVETVEMELRPEDCLLKYEDGDGFTCVRHLTDDQHDQRLLPLLNDSGRRLFNHLRRTATNL